MTVLDLQKDEADAIVKKLQAGEPPGERMPDELIDHITPVVNSHIANLREALPVMSHDEVGLHLQKLVMTGCLFGWRLGVMNGDAGGPSND